jgi:hypothetical protein
MSWAMKLEVDQKVDKKTFIRALLRIICDLASDAYYPHMSRICRLDYLRRLRNLSLFCCSCTTASSGILTVPLILHLTITGHLDPTISVRLMITCKFYFIPFEEYQNETNP